MSDRFFSENGIPSVEYREGDIIIKRRNNTHGHIIYGTYKSRDVTIKTFPQSRISDGVVECKLQFSCDHPSILKPIGAYTFLSELCLMMPYYCQGNLADFVDEYGADNITPEEWMSYTSQIQRAIQYLHTNGIAHRDIKPENILMSDDLSRLYLTDFGYSKQVTQGQIVDDSRGTPYYAAPEIFLKVPHDPKKADVWAFGVTIWYILFGYYPFRCKEDEDICELSENVIRNEHSLIPQPEKVIDPCILDTFDMIFEKDFKLRPNITGIKFF